VAATAAAVAAAAAAVAAAAEAAAAAAAVAVAAAAAAVAAAAAAAVAAAAVATAAGVAVAVAVVFPRTLFFGMSQNEFSKTRSTRPFCTSGTGAKRRVEHKSSSRAQDAEKFPVANLLVFYVRSAPLQSNDSSGKSRNNMNAV